MKQLVILIISFMFLSGCSITDEQLMQERKQEAQCLEEIEKAYFFRNELGPVCRNYILNHIQQSQYIEATDLFLQAYLALDEGRVDEAEKQFEEAIKLINPQTPRFVKIYSHKLLAGIKIDNGKTHEAWQLTQKALDYIHRNQYNQDYKIVWDVLGPMIHIPGGDIYVTQEIEYIVERAESGLEEQAKMFFYRKLTGLYALRLNYFEAIETSIKMLEFAEDEENHYYIAKSMVDISIIAKSLGANTTAIEILDAIQLDIDEPLRKADFEIYKALNLAENKIILGKYEEAIQDLDKLEEYKGYLPEWKSRTVSNIKSIKLAEIAILEKDIPLAKNYLASIHDQLTSGDTVSYESVKGDYIRVLALIYQLEDKYEEAKHLYKQILNREIEGTDYEDYKNAFNSLLDISVIQGNDEEINQYLKLIKHTDENVRNSTFDNYYRYIYNNYFYDKVKEQNEYIEQQNLVYIVISSISVLGIGVFLFLPKLTSNKRKATIRKYMHNNHYYLVYQPIVNPRLNKVVGLEALLRLKVNEEVIYPNQFIPKIEEAGMMKEVALWILQQIRRDAQTIGQIKGLEESFYISMNISMNEIEDESFINQLQQEIAQHKDSKEVICLEITENTGVKDSDLIRKHIHQLIEYGFIIAVDDFGVDYSNISMLEHFDFHILKLDKYFIDHIHDSIVVQGMIKTINSIAKDLEIKIVVEGVEEAWQKEEILETTSDQFYIQGYYYSKPLELENLVHVQLEK